MPRWNRREPAESDELLPLTSWNEGVSPERSGNSLPASGEGRDAASDMALKPIVLQIPAELWHRLRVAALQEGRPMEGLATSALCDYLRTLSPALMS